MHFERRLVGPSRFARSPSASRRFAFQHGLLSSHPLKISHLNSPPLSVLVGTISYIVADLLVLLVTLECDSLPPPALTLYLGSWTLFWHERAL